MSLPSSKKHVPKVVLDVNVWVSALLWGGKPAEIVVAAEKRQINVFLSEEIVQEFSQVLSYPKIKKIYQTEGLNEEKLVEAVLKVSKFVGATEKVKVVMEHPADDKFIECAQAAGAKYIVSGDKHLLKIAHYKKTRILSVNEFLQILQNEHARL